MSTRTPPTEPEQEMIDFLVANWNPSEVRGYDPTAGPGESAHLPVADTIDAVGAVYPSLIVSFSNETSGGETTYDFMTENGPGQSPQGTLLATARAADRESGYTGDAGSYSAVDARTIIDEIAGHALDICRQHPLAPGTKFSHVGGQRGPDVPPDFDVTPPVRLSQRQLDYGALYVP